MSETAAFKAIIYGRVQKIGFRAFAARQALNLKITGYVRNLPQSAVEVHAEGSRDLLERFIAALRRGPPGARIDRFDIDWIPYSGKYSKFEISLG